MLQIFAFAVFLQRIWRKTAVQTLEPRVGYQHTGYPGVTNNVAFQSFVTKPCESGNDYGLLPSKKLKTMPLKVLIDVLNTAP